MEFLLLSLGVLVYSIVGVIILAAVSAAIETIAEYREWWNDSRELSSKNKEIRALNDQVNKLDTSLTLWKKACDNLEKEMVLEVSKKSDLS